MKGGGKNEASSFLRFIPVHGNSPGSRATMLPHKEIHVEQKNDDVPAVNAHAFLHIVKLVITRARDLRGRDSTD